jgi:hypothetical protein
VFLNPVLASKTESHEKLRLYAVIFTLFENKQPWLFQEIFLDGEREIEGGLIILKRGLI